MMTVKRAARVNVSTLLPQAERARLIANVARKERDRLIATRQAPPSYRTLVDGRDNAPEESIRPGGAIIYRFNTLGQAAIFALVFARERSPSLSGDYRRAWVVVVNGKPWAGNLNDVPSDAELLVVNSAPYHRKINTGAMRTIGRGVVEATRQAVMKRFPNLMASVVYADLSGPIAGFQTPYVLKQASRSSADRYAGRRAPGRRTALAPRKDAAPGGVMTYPAILIQNRVGYA